MRPAPWQEAISRHRPPDPTSQIQAPLCAEPSFTAKRRAGTLPAERLPGGRGDAANLQRILRGACRTAVVHRGGATSRRGWQVRSMTQQVNMSSDYQEHVRRTARLK